MPPIVVITRFNLAVRYRFQKLYGNVPKGKYLWLDEDYLKRRFELFEKYTVSSFAGQTDPDFRWIVLFHKDTPKQFIERINDYKDRLPQFEPWYLDDDGSERFADVLTDEFNKDYGDTGVASVRVDNDDVVHSEFVETIRKSLDKCNETTILSFKNGLQYDVRNRRCVRYSYVNNHFITLYSACKADEKIRCVYGFQHVDADNIVDRGHKIVKKTRIPLWVEIVSETNCVNEIWTKPSKVLVPYEVKNEFPMLNLKWTSRIQWLFYTMINIPGAFFRMFIDVFKLYLI